MKRVFALSLFVMASLMLAVPAMAADLLVGRDGAINVGTVSVYYDFVDGSYDVEFSFTLPSPLWSVNETHAEVASDPSLFPKTKSGNPKVGKFTGKADAPPWTCTVEAPLLMPVYIAAHVELLFDDDGDELTPPIEESAWAAATGDEIPGEFAGSNWATYFGAFPVLRLAPGKVRTTTTCWGAIKAR